MSAIGSRGRMHFTVFTESFTAEVMCRFLDRLANHFGHEVHLVVDAHSVHRSGKVRGSFDGPHARYVLDENPMSL